MMRHVPPATGNRASLPEGYRAAERICQRHARTFYFSSFFLPRRKRFDAYAVYAFCRLLDDAIDVADESSPDDLQRRLDGFRSLLDRIYRGDVPLHERSDPELALLAFADVVERRDIPQRYFVELAEGCGMDLTINRYARWTDLELYCYRVAGVVGLIMTRVFGIASDDVLARAVDMGNAMQLTNILRDVREDYARGRIYLPQDELQQFGVTEHDIAAGLVTPNWRDLMRLQVERARALYRRGSTGLPALPNDGSRFTACAMGVLYSGILGQIERQEYDVFHRRAALSTVGKLMRLPRAWRLCQARDPRHAGDAFT